MAETPFSFFALEALWLRSNRTWRVFVTRDQLNFGYIAGQIYDDNALKQVLHSFGILAPLFRRSLQRRLDQARERDRRFATLSPESSEFLSSDSRNFRLERRVIDRALLLPRANVGKVMWAMGPTVGRLDLHARPRGRMRLFLLGGQDIEEIESALRRVVPHLDILRI